MYRAHYWHRLQSLPRPDGKRTMEERCRVRDDSLQAVSMAHRRLATSSL